METCSWCTEEVPASALREQPDGARLCPECCRAVATGQIFALMDAVDG